MKHMKRIFIVLALLLCSIGLWADEQILVFRNDGSINLFRSEKLTEIACSTIDADGFPHENVEYQHFIFSDTTIVIPIAEIDSVTFGNRDRIQPKKNARRIKANELPFITKYDGKKIFYKPTASADIIPTAGTYIYYDAFCEQFPYGLAAKVLSIGSEAGEIAVNVIEVSAREIFDEYFVSGDFELEIPAAALSEKGYIPRAPQDMDKPFELTWENIGLSAEGIIKISFTNVVASLLTGYFHADISTSVETGLKLKVESDDSGEIKSESKRARLLQGVIAGVLYPRLDIALFVDFAASMRLNYEFKRIFNSHYEWKRMNGVNTFVMINDSDENGATTESSLEAILDGTLHFGLLADMSINTLFDSAGAGIEAKFGPELSSEFGFGMVQTLENGYEPDIFSKSHLDICMLAKLESYYYHLDSWAWGNQEKHSLPFSAEWRFMEQRLNLLPEFSSRAVAANVLPEPSVPYIPVPGVDIASTTSTPIEYPLGLGYELVDKVSERVIAQAFLEEEIEKTNDSLQGFNKRLPANGYKRENLYARPIVRYGGKIIKCQPTEIAQNANISPSYTGISRGGTYVVGGATTIGTVKTTLTTYIIGNNIPVVKTRNEVFKDKRTFKTVDFINNEGAQTSGDGASIFGRWSGSFKEKAISLELNSNGSAKYNGELAALKVNSPQSGVLALLFNDGRSLLIWVHSISSNTLTISFENSNEIITLNR